MKTAFIRKAVTSAAGKASRLSHGLPVVNHSCCRRQKTGSARYWPIGLDHARQAEASVPADDLQLRWLPVIHNPRKGSRCERWASRRLRIDTTSSEMGSPSSCHTDLWCISPKDVHAVLPQHHSNSEAWRIYEADLAQSRFSMQRRGTTDWQKRAATRRWATAGKCRKNLVWSLLSSAPPASSLWLGSRHAHEILCHNPAARAA